MEVEQTKRMRGGRHGAHEEAQKGKKTVLTYSPKCFDISRARLPASQHETPRESETLLISCGSTDRPGTAANASNDLYMPLPLDDSEVIAKVDRGSLRIETKSPTGQRSNFTRFSVPTLNSRVVSREHASFSITRTGKEREWCITALDLGSKHGIYNDMYVKISEKSADLSRGDTAGFVLGAELVTEGGRSTFHRANYARFAGKAAGFEVHCPVTVSVSASAQ